jgi:1,4-alpha-glucan branching enzyme
LPDGSCPLKHGTVLKLAIETHNGAIVDRISPWARFVTQDKETKIYQQVFYNPAKQDVIFEN